MNNDRNKDNRNEKGTLKPDPETLHTTDPQEHMKGPVSSAMHEAGESFDTDESKEDADKKREQNM